MKLADHTDKIRTIIDKSFRNRLGRMGIAEKSNQPIENIPYEYHEDRKRIETIFDTLIEETNHKRGEAYEKLVEEFTFTLFNRLTALKVIEAHRLNPEVITRQTMHGGRSFAHLAWLEQHTAQRDAELEGLNQFLEDELQKLSAEINLFSLEYPYHLLPTPIELNQIIEAFNEVENDKDVEENIWQSDDVIGWLYESYNNYKKAAHKESKAKTEYNKVSIQSQVYTPRWVVKFLVDNSLGKLYLEMFPESEIKDKYKIANAPNERIREPKPITEIKIIDPACGSANFLLYAFDLFYDIYLDQIENFGADYDEREIPELIIHQNLHGIDLDDRATQIAQFGLYIKAKRRRRTAKIEHFNIVSSDFYLPDFEEVRELFETDAPLKPELEEIVREVWTDLQQAHKFGALLRIEEKFNAELESTIAELKSSPLNELGYAETISDYYKFRTNFFDKLHSAVELHNKNFGLSFLSFKTADALKFLELLTQKYDVAVANPPYTDSSDFGAELKSFIEANYKKPYKFNTNLYATFIKRNFELTNDSGYIALIHPHTFMFIKTFEDVRKFMIEKSHIDLLVDYGLDRVNLFGTGILLDATWYVLSKQKKSEDGIYFNITANQQEKHKQVSFETAIDDLLNDRNNNRIYKLKQSKLKIIEGSPFIYWISDGFREKFKKNTFGEMSDVINGVKTGNNEKLLRFWWEVNQNQISNNYEIDRKPWVKYAKGGPFNRWFGNVWLVVNYLNEGSEIKKSKSYCLLSKENAFRQGITYSDATSKGVAFRIIENDVLFDMSGPGILPKDKNDLNYAIALLNTNLISYIASCLNSTVHTQTGDIKRIPFVKSSDKIETDISSLSLRSIEIKRQLCSYRIFELNFNKNPLLAFSQSSLQERLLEYLNYENSQLASVLLNEAIINGLIFEVYELSPEDREQVEAKMGKPVGELPVLVSARDEYLQLRNGDDELRNGDDDLSFVDDFIRELPAADFDEDKVQKIKAEFATLYQSNNDLEEFCIRHQVNPINVWYWFRESRVIPKGRAGEIALEFLADVCRTVLIEDEDGIAPLVGLPGETALLDRLEEKCLSLGLTSAQFAQLDQLLSRPVKEYLEQHFFKNLSDHLNLFMYLPKTPFIWHLTSGGHQGFEAYIIIYKWTRDSLYKLKTKYIARRVESLNYRLANIAQAETAAAQTEKDLINLQLQEITDFTRKVDELIAEDYNPTLDDGVGKNIAPLQNKGMLKAEVLNSGQLKKYLNADW